MTFDEAIAKVGTYLKNNDLSNSDNNERFFYIILNDLRQEYAPTVEMTKKQYNTFKWHKDNLDFSACLGTFQNYNGETRMGIKFDNLKGDLSDEDIMQAWLHPETIKIVDE
ncbi:hypothetical protein [Leuconostoc mesenteroides]|jgi:hypothetical protein|uniref:hypothetical protein n=1 Tax=Leuconostoc mesenteroides TaxID=1245 RepID=UPI001CBB5040|nr:hypothetical protein [Leuconostoc mesenteroides]MBZ1527801.1 hypothetical protein [Leuconostoc mesenteroides]MCI2152382.1 hypothetical protein [Leuconostoc mesenteroides]MCI2168000.1 hypothetical protein [Leuconostoc mesenteroides]